MSTCPLCEDHTLNTTQPIIAHLADLHLALSQAHDIIHRLIPRYGIPRADPDRITTNYVTLTDITLWDRANGHLAPLPHAAPCIGSPTP